MNFIYNLRKNFEKKSYQNFARYLKEVFFFHGYIKFLLKIRKNIAKLIKPIHNDQSKKYFICVVKS